MDYSLLLLLLYAMVLSLTRFASSSPYSVCPHEHEVFQLNVESKCPVSMSPNPPLEVDGNFLDRIMNSKRENGYTAVLFYASWCPFSREMRPKFDILSLRFPRIEHLAVEQSYALPSVFSRYGIRSFPSIVIVNQSTRVRYGGPKDLSSLIQFYETTTGHEPIQYVADEEPKNLVNRSNLMTRFWNGPSVGDIIKTEPYLVFAILFLCLRAIIFVFPRVISRLKALYGSYIPHLNLGIFGETSQLFGRVLHMIDVRRIWTKLRLSKNRNFHERAKNARVWASSLTSVSLGESSSARLSS